MNSIVYNSDCMEGMKQYPDKWFDLSLVDPPYGIGEDGSKNHTRGKLAVAKNYKAFSGNDKEAPNVDYFNELRRVSKHQIIWGANHFISKIPFDSSCWIVWDKVNGENDFADCELAYTSFKSAVRQVKFMWHGFMQGADFKGGMQGNKKLNETRIHPTQKPVALYDWIYKNYLPNGGRVLDSHLGSGSNRIAADKAGNIDFTAFEIDKDYFDAQEKRFKEYKAQLKMFI